jgi:hypothetical protein
MEIHQCYDPLWDSDFILNTLQEYSISIDDLKEVECLICSDDVLESDTKWFIHTCERSNICSSCIKKHVCTKIEELQIEIKCICGIYLSDQEINQLSTEKHKNIREINSIKKALNSMPDYKHCPSPICTGGGFIDNINSYFICSSCPMKICYCGDEYHPGFTCKQRKEWRESNSKRVELTKALIANSPKGLFQSCPKCLAIIEKNGGCPHVKCINCNHEFCWLCGETYYNGHIRDKHTTSRTTLTFVQQQASLMQQLQIARQAQQLRNTITQMPPAMIVPVMLNKRPSESSKPVVVHKKPRKK